MLHVLPDVELKGYLFHWSQNVYRRIQEEGLVTSYREKDSTYQLCNMIFAVPLLPATHIEPAFDKLKQTQSYHRQDDQTYDLCRHQLDEKHCVAN